ncbi:MAG: hypothetical protein IPJ41_03105 [Phycisphaerales bacterium]|nr:hypothetical protein [Phycisphaerales bacterium]
MSRRPRLESASNALKKCGRTWRWVMVALGVIVMVQAIRSLGHGTAMTMISCILLVEVPAVAFGLFWFGSAVPPGKIREVLLANDLCPSCAGDLAGVEPEPGHSRVRCPECSAEWARVATLATSCCACGYDLAGLREYDNGTLQCPECGVVWRRDPAVGAKGGA